MRLSEIYRGRQGSEGTAAASGNEGSEGSEGRPENEDLLLPAGGPEPLPFGLTLLRAAGDRMLPDGCMDGWSDCATGGCRSA